MTDQRFDDSVVAADRWSKVIALLVAIAVFLLASELTADVRFNSIVAAVAGVGARLYIPYHASVRVPKSERLSLREHPVAGNYHHGAAGIALMMASLVSLGVFLLDQAFLISVGIGIISGVFAYFVLGSSLPTA